MKIICIVRRLTLAASTLFVCAALSSTAFADTGALRVNISDAEGNPVVGAVVTASSPDSLLSKSGVTNEDGDVRLAGLDPAGVAHQLFVMSIALTLGFIATGPITEIAARFGQKRLPSCGDELNDMAPHEG